MNNRAIEIIHRGVNPGWQYLYTKNGIAFASRICNTKEEAEKLGIQLSKKESQI